MPNIKSISSLRKYAEVLKEVEYGEPVFLTKNGNGAYAIVKIEEYNNMKALQILQQEVDPHISNEQQHDEGVKTIGTNTDIRQQFLPDMEKIKEFLRS